MKLLSSIWNDPVWSKVISNYINVILTAIFGMALLLILGPNVSVGTVFSHLIAASIPNWLAYIMGFFVVASLLCILMMKRRPKNLGIDSSDWFLLIGEKLKDCNTALIYLRAFDHPDDFKEAHRKDLLEILQTIKERLTSQANIKIITFCESQKKSGFDWLVAEIGDRSVVEKSIKIRRIQPVLNSSSMYLFDNQTLVFNKRANGSVSYHADTGGTSILNEFLRLGFEASWGND